MKSSSGTPESEGETAMQTQFGITLQTAARSGLRKKKPLSELEEMAGSLDGLDSWEKYILCQILLRILELDLSTLTDIANQGLEYPTEGIPGLSLSLRWTASLISPSHYRPEIEGKGYLVGTHPRMWNHAT